MTTAETPIGPELISYLDAAQVDWVEIEPGARLRKLHSDKATGQRILIVQWDPGYTLSFRDEHRHDEFLYILSGTFVDQHRASGPGTYIHNEPGSWHQPHTPDGCTFLTFISPRRPAGKPSAS